MYSYSVEIDGKKYFLGSSDKPPEFIPHLPKMQVNLRLDRWSVGTVEALTPKQEPVK